MALKDLLVHVDTDAGCAARVDIALALAARHEAHLTGLHVMAWPRLPGYVEMELPRSFLELQHAHLLERAQRAEKSFHERARRVGVPAEWRVAEGDVVETVKLHARYADLTVVGQGRDVKDAPGELALLPEELALGVGRPVLIVPRYGAFATVGERVLVAWNGTREATRAVNDAIPLLKAAAKVTVLAVDPADEAAPRVPSADIALHLARHGITADIALHLARHGITVEAASTRSVDIGVGDVLLSRAADLGVDLIVMGAYGHSRIREMALGGATRHILQHMTVPVLMSH
jgi:nucleotide-binding universal stress UspA family protein